MRNPLARALWLLSFIAVLFCLALSTGSSRAALPVDSANPATAGDWPMYGHDNQRTNFNPDETTINPSNVTQLVPIWQSYIGIGDYPSSSDPVVSQGRVFVGSSAPTGPNYFAFNALSGASVWTTTIGYESVPECPPNVGVGSTAAISGTLLAVGGGDSAYYGLNTNTGAQIWRHPLDAGTSAFAWSSPLLGNVLCYLGVASYCDNPSIRGEARALDPSNGGLQANQWFVPANERGAGVWNSPALSPDGHTLVVATGEDYVYDGPYNRAMVTLDATTLAIIGANKQGLPYHDHDWGSTPIIFHDSQGRLLVAANHKNGTFYTYLLDNVSAGPIWQRYTDTSVGAMPAYDPNFGPGGTLS